MKDVIEIIAGVCGVAFDETEPAACLIARRLGVSELDVCSAFFGSDTATYERCIAEGARRLLTDAAYSQALDRIQTKVLSDLVGAALAELKIPYRDISNDAKTGFGICNEGYEVRVFVGRDGIVSETFDKDLIGRSSAVRAFVEAFNEKYALLGSLGTTMDCMVYAVRLHLPSFLSNSLDETEVAVTYGAKILHALSSSFERLRFGGDETSAMLLAPSAWPMRDAR